MFLDNQYQIGYLTRDLDEAIKALQGPFGTPPFQGLNGDEIATHRLWTPNGEVDVVARGAVCQVGHLCLELIQPLNDAVPIFNDYLAPGELMRMHHLAMRVDDLDTVREESARLGRPTVLAGSFLEARFIYVDATATLGHYIEYVSAPAAFWGQ